MTMAKMGAISNKHRIKNARNEEKVSAHTGLYPQGELIGINKNVIPRPFSNQ